MQVGHLIVYTGANEADVLEWFFTQGQTLRLHQSAVQREYTLS